MREMTAEQFLKDVAKHKMTVLLDNGIYRHLRFDAGTFNRWFELVTFPGTLVINGDMGSWTFSRVADMFTFFRSPGLRINPEYWDEKVQSDSRFGGPSKKFVYEVWVQRVLDRLRDCIEDPKERAEVEQALYDEVFDEDLGEESLVRALCDFEHGDHEFSDWYEIDGKEYTPHFLWCLYAIVWGIQQYDAAAVPTLEMTTEEWLSRASAFRFDDREYAVTIEARLQRDGEMLWVVSRGGSVLNSDGEWEYEPLPSSRDDDYIFRTRMCSKEAALDRLRQFTEAR